LSQTALLEARGLKVHFGGVRAVDGVDLVLPKGEILGLIGPNGAGKTTLVNALSGFQKPTAGTVFLDGIDVTGWQPARLARTGLTRTFQSVRLFPDLSVLENVELGGVGVGMRRPTARRWAQELLERLGSQTAPICTAPACRTDSSGGSGSSGRSPRSRRSCSSMSRRPG
jgi:branched-chain amino acid transport system ATP-binding protein